MWRSGGVLLTNMPNLQIKEGSNTGEHSTNPKRASLKVEVVNVSRGHLKILHSSMII